ncbi:MAG: DUF58 domain-containing protein [Ferruginibacter sp.]
MDLFVTTRFYIVMGVAVIIFVAAFFIPVLLNVASYFFSLAIIFIMIDYFFMFFLNKTPAVLRNVSDRLSNGDWNYISIKIKNRMPWAVRMDVIDELPEQLQQRNFKISRRFAPAEQQVLEYSIRPLERGEYYFGGIKIYVKSMLGLVLRRYHIDADEKINVYPSFLQLRKHQLLSHGTQLHEQGSRRIRKTGQSMEFEQVKDYVSGDDIRTINWKATARKGMLMVNNYVNEKSQQVYCIVDKGRLMKMPFNGLSLLDYAINSTLALSNVCLQKQDKIGLLSFSNKMGTIIAAERKPVQRENILQALFKESTAFLESDYEMLYTQIRHKIKQRSLLILFTNFESVSGLTRQVNYLRSIAKHHLLLVVFFENTELNSLSRQTAINTDEVYSTTIAEKFAFEKRMVVKELQKYGILSILTPPENLTVNIINKYLEIKARQAL